MPTQTRQRELTASQFAVLKAAAAGLTVAATAERMGRSVETVKTHRKRLLRALGASGITQAVALAYANGILGERVAPEDTAIREGQLRAFHGKAAALDQQSHDDRGTAKRETLALATLQFGRPIESANDLSSREASWCLDHLEELLNS